MDYNIVKLNSETIHQLEQLAKDALQDGYKIVRRTIDQWVSGENQFDKYQEVLYAVEIDQSIVAIGGINIDPYLMDDDIGRVRHFYVHRQYRQKGIARALLELVLKEKAAHYTVIRLTTNNEAAMQLYEEFGFKKVVEFKATHVKVVKTRY